MSDISQRAALLQGTYERRNTSLLRGVAFDALPAAVVEQRGLSPSVEGWQLNAYASVYDVPYTVHDQFGSFTETVSPNAFRRTLSKNADVVFRYDHDGIALGRTSAKTLRLSGDGPGLSYSVDLDPDSPTAQSLRSAVRRRDVTESSFAFQVVRDEWDAQGENRTLLEVSLQKGDVSAVTWGASPTTGESEYAASLRSTPGDSEYRAKYNQGDRDKMAKAGAAMADGSYPIADADDLDNAIHAVGRGGASHNAIRKHIIARAKALGLSSKIPDNWNADGSSSEADAAIIEPDWRLITPRQLGDAFRECIEIRAGAVMSGSTKATVTHALSLFATADHAVDEGQMILSELLGVTNPDSDDDDDSERSACDLTEKRSGATCTCCVQSGCDGGCCGTANADAASDSGDQPNADAPTTTLSKFEDYDYRIRIARLRGAA